ncbi:MAG: efflux RND transporter periplasmic adaptor subunit [Waddliaceae bacterium]
MKKLFIIFFVVLALIGAGLGAFFYFHGGGEKRILTLYGNVDVRQVDIAFRVAGQVEALYFEEGDVVPEGSLMAELDTTPYSSQLQEAKANLASIKANLKNAEILLKRRRELIDGGSVSEENLDDALANRNALFANFTAAEAAVQVSRDNLTYTKAHAPTEGIILTRIREPGTVVNPADPVYTLSIISPVWVRAYVSEPNLGKIYYGMEAKVHTDVIGAPIYTGKVGFISPVAEFTPKTVQTTQLRTDLVYRLRIYIDNPDNILKQGMPVTVELDTSWIKGE